MTQLIGLLLVIALVIGGLLYSTSHAILAAIPMELALIGGAALGTLLIGNSVKVAGAALAGFRALKGSRWTAQDYTSLLTLLHTLTRRAKQGGIVAIEADIERPQSSAAFKASPALEADPAIESLICDSFRMMALDHGRSGQIDAQMDRTIDAHIGERMKAVTALHTMADALPALGIVAAVLGIIRTMGVIDQSPAVLGAMIGTALLGTFLGVFLAYGVVGPVASRYGQIVEEDAQMLDVARAVLSAYSNGVSPRACIEIGRSAAPMALQPTAAELDRALQSARFRQAPRAAA